MGKYRATTWENKSGVASQRIYSSRKDCNAYVANLPPRYLVDIRNEHGHIVGVKNIGDAVVNWSPRKIRKKS